MMTKKFKNICVLISLLGLVGLNGCAAVVVGIGAAGASAFAYINGELVKTYETEYHQTVRASNATLEKLKIPVSETLADELKTKIKAVRPDGTPVAIEIVRIEPYQTQVAVRTGSLGIWDRRASEQIQGYINEELGFKTAAEQKPPENLGTRSDQPTAGKAAGSEIVEEDLGESPSMTAVEETVLARVESQALEKESMETAQMLADSIFVIFFEKDTNELSPKAVDKLNRVFEILSRNSETEIVINGYSDSTGAIAYNEMISETRAKAVKSYLIAKGIAPRRMQAFGYGPQKFIATNRTEEGRKMNRRVEIEIVNP